MGDSIEGDANGSLEPGDEHTPKIIDQVTEDLEQLRTSQEEAKTAVNATLKNLTGSISEIEKKIKVLTDPISEIENKDQGFDRSRGQICPSN